MQGEYTKAGITCAKQQAAFPAGRRREVVILPWWNNTSRAFCTGLACTTLLWQAIIAKEFQWLASNVLENGTAIGWH